MADGLLTQGLNYIDQQKQALAARLGLLMNNPQEFAAQLGSEARQRAGVGLLGEPKTAQEMASGAWINSPYGQQAMQAGSGFAGTISPAVARQIPMKTNLPQSSEFISAVQNTPNAQITNEGLLMRVQRNQVPEQSGMESVRTGVFYLPEGSGNARYYSGTGAGKYYGGTEKITGETLLRNPLFIKGATGGKAPEVAYDAIKGKGAIKELDEDVSRILSLSFIKRNDPRTYFEAVEGFLSKYGGDPSTAENIVQNSQKGNQLKYALRENAIANTVRNAGHDAVLGYSKGKQGNFLSEVFDLREATYPTKEGGYTLNPMFQPK
jgi:hypothetical protein